VQVHERQLNDFEPGEVPDKQQTQTVIVGVVGKLNRKRLAPEYIHIHRHVLNQHYLRVVLYHLHDLFHLDFCWLVALQLW